MQFWLAILFAMFVTMALIPFFRRCAIYFHAVDLPNERKVHTQPMAKTGGLAMAVGAMIPLLLWIPEWVLGWPLLVSSLLIVGFGFLDDLRDLSSSTKFSMQIVAAAIVVVFGDLKIISVGMLLPDELVVPDIVAVPLTVFVIVGVTNAINLSDGLDGLAGGVTLLSFLCIGYLAFIVGNHQVVLIAAALVGAIFGFLRFNTYPASVFMGDAGSQLLGFLAIVLSIDLTQSCFPYSPLLPLLLLGFPILDTLTVMTERIVNGRSPFVADKNHFHHKLMKRGLTHAEAVLIIYLLQTTLIFSAYFLRFYSDWTLLLGYLAFSAFILAGFHLAQKFNLRFNTASASRFQLRGRLHLWLNREMAIKVSFRGLQLVLLLVLLLISIQPTDIPRWLGIVALVLLVATICCQRFFRSGHGLLLRLGVYLVPPVLIYQIEAGRSDYWLNTLGNLLFAALLLLVVAVIRFSRRVGYRSTPLDYLVLLLALLVPNLNLFDASAAWLGMVSAKLLLLFFSLEVLLEEQRTNYRLASMGEYLMLMVVVFRSTT